MSRGRFRGAVVRTGILCLGAWALAMVSGVAPAGTSVLACAPAVVSASVVVGASAVVGTPVAVDASIMVAAPAAIERRTARTAPPRSYVICDIAPFGWVQVGNLAGARQVFSLIELDDRTLLAGTAHEGKVFRSHDAGRTWREAMALPGAEVVRSLAVDDEGTVFAGTYPGARLFRSRDRGDRWETIHAFPHSREIYSLLAVGTDTLLVGLYPPAAVAHCTDGGRNWSDRQLFPGEGGVFSLLQSRDGTIYAGTYPGGRIFSSRDRGRSWMETGEPAGAQYVRALVEDEDGRLFAGTYPQGRVFRSLDRGQHWELTADLEGAEETLCLLAVRDRLYAGTTLFGHIFRTTDAGSAWADVSGDLWGEGLADYVHCLLETSGGVILAGTSATGDIFALGYARNRVHISPVFALPGEDVLFRVVGWEPVAGGEPSIIRVRTGLDPRLGDAEPWERCPRLENGQMLGGVSSVREGDHFLQYRIDLPDSPSAIVPAIRGISIGWEAGPPAREPSGRWYLRPLAVRGEGLVRFRVSVPEGGYTVVSVLDRAGSIVRILVAEDRPVGGFELVWNGESEVGEMVDEGVYIVSLMWGRRCAVRRFAFFR